MHAKVFSMSGSRAPAIHTEAAMAALTWEILMSTMRYAAIAATVLILLGGFATLMAAGNGSQAVDCCCLVDGGCSACRNCTSCVDCPCCDFGRADCCANGDCCTGQAACCLQTAQE